MIAIRAEMPTTAAASLLRNAPHTAACVLGRRLDRSPTPGSRPPTRSRPCAPAKYWPPVRRIDGAYGDRNLVCACPPLADT